MFSLSRKVNGRPLLVGHQGAMGAAPGNTMPAFEQGLAGGADILELDVQLTIDGQVIVFHDFELNAKTSATGLVAQHTADFLQTLDVGSYFDEAFAGVTIPLLDQVLAWAKPRIPLMIELKHGPVFNPALDEATIALIEQHNMEDRVVVTSFDQFALRRVKQLNPHITTSFIYIARLLNPLEQVRDLQVDALSPASNFLTPTEVKLIQAAGYACSPGGFWWDYPTLLEWGVDTISSNDPATVNVPGTA